MRTWIAFWNILLKDIRSYYLKPPNISWGLLFPLVWITMFFIRSGFGMEKLPDLLPGLVALSILFGTTSVLSVTVTFEKKGGSFERLLLAPISLEILMLAKTSGAILFGTINALVPIFVAMFLTDLSGLNWYILVPAIVLIAISSTFLGLFIAVSVKEVFEALGYSVETTPASGDQGVDLIVAKHGRRTAVQAKGYYNSVSNKAVQEAFAGMAHYHCHACAVATNSRFTPAAKDLAASTGCILIDEHNMFDFVMGRVEVFKVTGGGPAQSGISGT